MAPVRSHFHHVDRVMREPPYDRRRRTRMRMRWLVFATALVAGCGEATTSSSAADTSFKALRSTRRRRCRTLRQLRRLRARPCQLHRRRLRPPTTAALRWRWCSPTLVLTSPTRRTAPSATPTRSCAAARNWVTTVQRTRPQRHGPPLLPRRPPCRRAGCVRVLGTDGRGRPDRHRVADGTRRRRHVGRLDARRVRQRRVEPNAGVRAADDDQPAHPNRSNRRLRSGASTVVTTRQSARPTTWPQCRHGSPSAASYRCAGPP